MASLRSRQVGLSGNKSCPNDNRSRNSDIGDKEVTGRGRRKALFLRKNLPIVICLGILSILFIFCGNLRADFVLNDGDPGADKKYAQMGSIVYGAKSKGDETGKFVTQAISAGFRHIATGGFHSEYNEQGVGIGWKESGVPRNELYLQTVFVARSVNGYGTQNCIVADGCPPSTSLSIEDQVHLSIKSSLHNLQTTYIDAVLVHNFRAKLQKYEDTLTAWKTLESYVDKGIIRHLGIVSVHDRDYLTKLQKEASVKPKIIQNRFHGNRGYDVELRPLFREMGMANQLFWILTGSAGGKVRNNSIISEIARKQGVSNQVLLYSFTIVCLGGTPLIGSKSLSHMKEDVEALLKKPLKWSDEDFEAVAGVVNKNLIKNKLAL
jgi:diketogulonate reductase-like aldo/keto reductase